MIKFKPGDVIYGSKDKYSITSDGSICIVIENIKSSLITNDEDIVVKYIGHIDNKVAKENIIYIGNEFDVESKYFKLANEYRMYEIINNE